MMDQKYLEMPLDVGDTVTLYENVRVHEDDGYSADILFEDTVAQYVPETGLLRFEESGIGRAPFKNKLEEAEAFSIRKV